MGVAACLQQLGHPPSVHDKHLPAGVAMFVHTTARMAPCLHLPRLDSLGSACSRPKH